LLVFQFVTLIACLGIECDQLAILSCIFKQMRL
jgi:hypothetical protein